jgi:uncharacterized protein
MKSNASLDQPLTEVEFGLLEDFLISGAVSDEGMDISMLDGFIAAMVSGPNLMMPSDLLRWIWDAEQGESLPNFASGEESKRIIELILRHWNDINDTLNHTPEAYAPLIMGSKTDGGIVPVIDEWCLGYYTGIRIDSVAWAPLMAQHPDWFTAIVLYGTEEGWDELKRRQDSQEQHQAFADSLSASVLNIHRYWVAQRRMQIERGEMPAVIGRREPLRRSQKIGRNDPCPCGSGKKYKRCHGAADAFQVADPDDGVGWESIAHGSADAEPPLLHSPLSQRVARDGTQVEIEIYGDGKDGWLLEVVDEFGNSTVWDESFPTDSAALAYALNEIETEGISSVMGSAPANTTRH